MNAAPSWFAGLLQEEMEARGWTQKRTAEFLGKHPQNIHRWLLGVMPRPDEQEEIVIALGGDLNRARPSWKPMDFAAKTDEPEAVQAGEISSQDGRITWISEKCRPASALSVEAAIDPERWDMGQGPALLLRLGERLGDWPAGSTLVARGWREGARPPEGMLFAAAARSDAWGPGASGWRLRRLAWSDLDGSARYTALSLDPLRADAQALPADRLQLGAIACGVIMPV